MDQFCFCHFEWVTFLHRIFLFYLQLDRYVNGKLTINENIADNGGINLAFKAYQAWKEEHGSELSLPGFSHFTDEQMFFLAFAHASIYWWQFCVKIKKNMFVIAVMVCLIHSGWLVLAAIGYSPPWSCKSDHGIT